MTLFSFFLAYFFLKNSEMRSKIEQLETGLQDSELEVSRQLLRYLRRNLGRKKSRVQGNTSASQSRHNSFLFRPFHSNTTVQFASQLFHTSSFLKRRACSKVALCLANDKKGTVKWRGVVVSVTLRRQCASKINECNFE